VTIAVPAEDDDRTLVEEGSVKEPSDQEEDCETRLIDNGSPYEHHVVLGQVSGKEADRLMKEARGVPGPPPNAGKLSLLYINN